MYRRRDGRIFAFYEIRSFSFCLFCLFFIFLLLLGTKTTYFVTLYRSALRTMCVIYLDRIEGKKGSITTSLRRSIGNFDFDILYINRIAIFLLSVKLAFFRETLQHLFKYRYPRSTIMVTNYRLQLIIVNFRSPRSIGSDTTFKRILY